MGHTHRNMKCLQWHCRIQSLHMVTPDVVQASMAQMNAMHTLTTKVYIVIGLNANE